MSSETTNLEEHVNSKIRRRQILNPGRLLTRSAEGAFDMFGVSDEGASTTGVTQGLDQARTKTYEIAIAQNPLNLEPQRNGSLLSRLLALGLLLGVPAAGYWVGTNWSRFTDEPQPVAEPKVFPVGPELKPADLVHGIPQVTQRTAKDLAWVTSRMNQEMAQLRIPGIKPVDSRFQDRVMWGPKPLSFNTENAVMLATDGQSQSLGSREVLERVKVYSAAASERHTLNGTGPTFIEPNVKLRVDEALRRGRPLPGFDDLWEIDYKGEKRVISRAVAEASIEILPKAMDIVFETFRDKDIPLPDKVIPFGSGATGQMKIRHDERGNIVALESDFFEVMHIFDETEGKKGYDDYIEAYVHSNRLLAWGEFDPMMHELKSLYQKAILEKTGQKMLVKMPDSIGHQAMVRTVFQQGAGVVKFVRWLELTLER